MSNVAIMNVATLAKSNQKTLAFSFETKTNSPQFKSTLDKITVQKREQTNSLRETSKNENQEVEGKRQNELVNDKVRETLKKLEQETAKISSTVKQDESSSMVNETKATEASNETSDSEESLKKSEEELLTKVAELLQMTSEQLQQMLEKLQLNIADLFDVNNVMALLMEKMNLSDTTDLLLANDVTDTINQINELMEQHLPVQEPLQRFSKEIYKEQNTKKQDSVDLANLSGDNTGKTGSDKAQQPLNGTGTMTATGSSLSEESDMMNMVLDQQEEVASQSTTKSTSAFEGILNQVITQKSETILMNGEIQTITTEVTAKDIFDQIVTAIKVHKTDQSQEVTLQLNPKHLGKVQVSLLHENGGITGKFVVENDAVKELMENGMAALKEHLKSQGIEVTDLKITVRDTRSFFGNQENQQHSQQQGNKKSFRNLHFKRFEDEIADMDIQTVTQSNPLNDNSSIEFQA